MKINSISAFNTQPKTNKINQQPPQKAPSFGSRYEINGDTILTRQQVFTMGMLMNNFWMHNARNTFMDIKYKHVYGRFTIQVNDARDHIVEKILENNRIEFKKLDNIEGNTW